MPSYVFPGLTHFVIEAARQLDHRENAARASNNPTLSALANLCAQASPAKRKNAVMIMTAAAEFRNQLWISARAADLMIAETYDALGLTREQPPEIKPTGSPRGRVEKRQNP